MIRAKTTVSAGVVLAFSLLCYVLVAFFYGMSFQRVLPAAILASVLHAVMLHVLVWKLAQCLHADTRRILSPVSVFLVVTLFYFGITFLKYFADWQLYPEFTTDLTYRLLGTFLVFLSMLLLMRWWSWWSSRHQDETLAILNRLGQRLGFRIMVLIGCIISVMVFYMIRGAEANPAGGAILSRRTFILASIAQSMFFPMLVATFFLRKGSIRNICFTILMLSAVAILLSTGARNMLILTGLVVILLVLFWKRLKRTLRSSAVIFVLATPLLTLSFAVPLTTYVKMGKPNRYLVQTAQRGDLSDYAISISLLNHRPGPYHVLKNATLWAIPGTLIDKESLDYVGLGFQKAHGWRLNEYRAGYTLYNIDYPASSFSTGAYIGGYIGMVLFPLVWVGAFIWFIHLCPGLLKVAAYLCCINEMIHIELAAWSIIAVARNYLLFTAIMYLAIRLALITSTRLSLRKITRGIFISRKMGDSNRNLGHRITMLNKMQVTFYHRRPQGANFSIERLFEDVRRALPEVIETKVAVCRFASRGLFRRGYNMIEAAFRQGDVNHITGDVHFLAFLLRKRRTLLTICDLVSVHCLRGWRRSVFLFLWYWLPIKRVAVVSVISEATKEDLLRHIKVDPQKIRVVHNCVSDDFKPVPKEFNAANPVILQIGTGANKNLERVAEAVKDMACHLRIVGKVSDEQVTTLQQSGIDYSCVSNISDEEIVQEYCQCDMLAFVSTYEGFGLPIVEAQATGRPVITSTVCSMPEVAGTAACLVDPFDVSSIREGILKIINDSAFRDRLIQQGFENVERFRPETIARQYVEIYSEMLK